MKEIRTYEFSDRMKIGVSDEPYSLMLGLAGDICFVMDVIQGVGKFPGFDFWSSNLVLQAIINYNGMHYNTYI